MQDSTALLSALDLSPAGLGAVEDGRWTAVNTALCALLGRCPETLVGARVADTLDLVGLPDDVVGRRNGCLPDGRLVVLDVLVRATASGQAVRAESPGAAGPLQQHRQTQELVDSTETLLFVKDAALAYQQVNAAFARLVGRTPDQCRGLTDHELFPRSIADVYRANDAAVLASGERQEQLVGVPDPDRGMRTYRATKRPLLDADGRVWGIAGVGTDLTEETRSREALQQLNRDLVEARDEAQRHSALTDAVLDTVGLGVVACDAEGRLTMFNSAARAWHGAPAEAGLDAGAWAGRYALYAEDGTTPLSQAEVPLFRALVEGRVDGAVMTIAPHGLSPRTVEADGRAMRDAAGRPLGAVVAMHDTTEQRARAAELVQARDQALAAVRAKSAFLAAVSHEVRTPLYGMLGMLEVMLGDVLGPAQRERADVALRSGRTLLALLDDVLDLSKAEAAPLTLRPRPVDPVALLGDVVDASRGAAAVKGLDVALVVEPGVPAGVSLDPDRLRQVLLNLVGNAVKFTASGRVRVRLATDGPDRLRVDVADTGPGIAAEDEAGLFTPFEQGVAGRSQGGTGLGLALSQQLVALMGGTLGVQSTVQGSTFSVLLPAPAVAPPVRAVPSAPVRPGGPRKVLLVDDSEVNRLVGQSLLEQLGADVEVAAGGDEAVAAVRARPYDLVLMDRQMPGTDGLAATRLLRALPHGRDVHVVALTAGGEDQRQECLDAGMDDFLTKPVDLARLGALLAALPERRP
ncbi:MAG: histidine kinase [Frankiales bacterium]|nr:histidine kinase [Frankiales bacterium]